jgi:hypothetical protein
MKMKNFKEILFVTIMTLAFFAKSGIAQKEYSGIHLAKIQREINMMETILDEMFSSGFRASQPFRTSRVRGVYIPEVGVVFRMSGSPYSFQYIIDTREGNMPEAYVVSPGGKIRSASASTYRAMHDSTVFEFLEYYADASGQLRESEQIIIVFEPEPLTAVFNFQGQTIRSTPGGYTISVRKADIARLRARQLHSREFRKNVVITDSETNSRQKNQLKMFANVCQTRLNKTESEGYRIYGDVSDLFIDDFGAIFLFDAVPAHNSPHNIVMRIQEEIKRNEMLMQKMYELAEKRVDNRKIGDMLAKLQLESDSTRYFQRRRAYEQFEKRVTDLMLDYGRSLRILDRGQKLTIAVKIQDNVSLVPERVVFQVKKDDLDAYDTNKLDRQALAKRVSIKRYGVKEP